MKPGLRLLSAILLALLPPCLQAADADDAGVERIIVKWRSGADATGTSRGQHARDMAQRLGNPFASGRNLGGSLSVLQLASAQRGRQLENTLLALRADPAVESATADLHMHALYAPSDPWYSATIAFGGTNYDYQWYLKGAQPAAIRADAAWDITHGGASAATSPVVVAVVDTGIRPDHEDLAGKLLPGFDFVSIPAVANDGDGWDADPTDPGDYLDATDLASGNFPGKNCGTQPLDSTWHGTRVAGLVGASTDNGVGMAGVGFNVRIVPVRALGKCGGSLSDVLAAMYWAAGFYDSDSDLPIPAPVLTDAHALAGHPNLHPAQVINLSLGATGTCNAMYATAVREITAIGVLIVAAAGNDGAAVDQPANCEGVLAVAGLRHAGTKVGYSNLGSEVGIAAPAGNCVFVLDGQPCVFALNTLTNLGTQTPAADGYSTPFTKPSFGTSFSSPMAAATAGLMKAVNPALTPALLIARIRSSARAFPTASDTSPQPAACTSPAITAVQNTECICNTGVCGAGMLDAGAAVQAALLPAAIAKVTGPGRAGGVLTLDGSASAAASGRTLASVAWTVESTADGASTPTISNANQLAASISAPTHGTVTLRLTLVDDQGGSSFTRVTATAAGGDSESPPADTAVHRDGGGGLDIEMLGLLVLLFAARHARRQVVRHASSRHSLLN